MNVESSKEEKWERCESVLIDKFKILNDKSSTLKS